MNRTKTAALAALLSTTALGLSIAPTNAGAQTRAALVQDVDAPGRSPYQQAANAVCFATCTITFAAVPAGMRLVVTHINGTVDTIGTGLSPRVIFGSLTMPTVRGINIGSTYQLIFDQPTLAYFEAGQQPVVFMDFNLELSRSLSDKFAGPSGATLAGYYVKLP